MIPPPLALPLARLLRSPRRALPIAACIAATVGFALLERSRASAHGADLALLDVFGGIALPLLAYAVVGAVVGGDALGRAGHTLTAFGVFPRDVALGAIAIAAIATALVGASLAAVVAVIAHGAGDPPLAHDVVTGAWVAMVGGVAYVALFALGATLGRRGGGRSVALVVDAVLGGGAGGPALFTPRAHLRSLLGGDAPVGLSQPESALALLALAALFATLAVRRTSLR